MSNTAKRTADPILKTDGLKKRFGGLIAVDDVNFRLAPGELRCLIGPNGAGKSTFFKMLAGRHTPTEGTITFKGEDITNLLPHQRIRRGMSIKFQDVSIYPELTVMENLSVPLQRNSHEDTGRRMDTLLERINLQDKRTVVADELSHGEQQWLEIAMTISLDPDLLLLDEPTAGMTIEETDDTVDLIKSLTEEGMAVIVVEHDINFVRQIAEWITVLHNGSVFTEGTVSEIESDKAVQRIYLGEE
ncbi:ATP-binding cassette domain-containing protein [Halobellus sp. GM3]|uniref:ATP-binding cassette domain-containing protein n=1 Tax=Halobellus sp. GM3 TaxID=3458410 RepID=UPI00403DE106